MSVVKKISNIAAAGAIVGAIALAVPAVGGTLVAGGQQQGHGTWLVQQGPQERPFGHWLAERKSYGHWLANVIPGQTRGHGHWLADSRKGYGHWLG